MLIVAFFIYLLGVIVQSRLEHSVHNLISNVMQRIPLIGYVYDMAKRLIAIVERKDDGSFKGMRPVWCFFGGEGGAAVLALLPSTDTVMLDGEAYHVVLVPSAPVPVGGALVYVPVKWVKPADVGIDGLMSLYVAMGVTTRQPGIPPTVIKPPPVVIRPHRAGRAAASARQAAIGRTGERRRIRGIIGLQAAQDRCAERKPMTTIARRSAPCWPARPVRPRTAQAQTFPNRPIRVLVTIPPGGAPDISARHAGAAPERNARLVGGDREPSRRQRQHRRRAVAKSTPDGYTLLLHADFGVTINPHVYAKLPFDALKDLLPVTSVATNQFMLSLNPQVPAKTSRSSSNTRATPSRRCPMPPAATAASIS